MKSLDPLRAKKILIRKKLGHTAVSAIKAIDLAKGASGKYCKFAIFNMAVVKSKNTKLFQICLENESKRMINS